MRVGNVLWALLFSLPGAGSPVAAGELPPIEAFFNAPTCGARRLSPSGHLPATRVDFWSRVEKFLAKNIGK